MGRRLAINLKMFASPRIKESTPITDSGSLPTAMKFSEGHELLPFIVFLGVYDSPSVHTTVSLNFEPLLLPPSHSEVKSEVRFLGTMVLPRDEWTWQLMATEFIRFDFSCLVAQRRASGGWVGDARTTRLRQLPS